MRSISHRRRRSARHSIQETIILTFALIILALPPRATSQAPSATQQLRLDKIEVVGLRRYTKEQVIDASGLQIGQAVNADLLDSAASRMAGSRTRWRGSDPNFSSAINRAAGTPSLPLKSKK